jgi:hypothetical protein
MRAMLLAAVVMVTGCDVGSVTVPAPNSADANPNGAADASNLTGADANPNAVSCRNAVNTIATGNHNAGTDCMAGNCHGPGGAGPTWSVAGTLYDSAAGNTPIVGATITIVDANGATQDLVSAKNGNFYTATIAALPVKTYASKCPTLTPMIAMSAVGSCNSCHVPGSATGAVHLP